MPPDKPNIGLIILAAGSSSRMSGKPKQLLEINGKTLLRRAAETAIQAKFDETVIVLGANSDKLQNEICDLPLQIAINENWQYGMSSSIKTGLTAHSEKNLNAVIIMLCDQPLITAKTLQQLREAFQQTGKPVIASKYEETIGVPALFSRDIFEELKTLKGNDGAKKIIKKYESKGTFILIPEAAIDIDTFEDYEKIKNSLS